MKIDTNKKQIKVTKKELNISSGYADLIKKEDYKISFKKSKADKVIEINLNDTKLSDEEKKVCRLLKDYEIIF